MQGQPGPGAAQAEAGCCASCHSGALFTGANTGLHPAGDSVAAPKSPSDAPRSAKKQYRTPPLKCVWQCAPHFQGGSAATLRDVVRGVVRGVVRNSDRKRGPGLTAQQVGGLSESQKSL